MEQNTKQTGLQSRKGVTIVEVAIALAIIAIVSASAVGMVLISVNIEAKFVANTYTENSVESVLECFQFAENEEIFYEALQKLDDYQYDSEKDAYIFDGKYLTVTVTVDFDGEKNLNYTAKRNTGEEIYSYTYPMGGAAG